MHSRITFNGFFDSGCNPWGSSFAGSMVWADIREYDDVEGCFTQIFGHTAQKNTIDGTLDGPYSVGNNICVDCGECFYLDDEGLLCYLDADRVVLSCAEKS